MDTGEIIAIVGTGALLYYAGGGRDIVQSIKQGFKEANRRVAERRAAQRDNPVQQISAPQLKK